MAAPNNDVEILWPKHDDGIEKERIIFHSTEKSGHRVSVNY